MARWSKERESRLISLYLAGWSDKDIAQELDVTVCSVVGKRWRMQLPRSVGVLDSIDPSEGSGTGSNPV